MEELLVGTRAHFVDHRWLEVDEETARHVASILHLGEEGGQREVVLHLRAFLHQTTVLRDVVFEAEELPASVAHLDTRLAHVDREHLAHLLLVLSATNLPIATANMCTTN